MKSRLKIFQFIALLQFAAFIYMQVTPLPEILKILTFQDKIAHFLGFLISGGMVMVAFGNGVVLWFQLLVVSIMAECLQKIVPGRFFDLYDMLANAMGLAAAFIIVHKAKARAKKVKR